MQNRVDHIENVLKNEEMEILFARVASNFLIKGNLDDAIRICQDGLKKYPAYAQAHYILATCYNQKEMIEEARAEYERVLRFDPNHLNAIKQLEEIYQSTGLEDVYKEYLLKRFTLDPLNEEVIEKAKQAGLYRPKTQANVIMDESIEALTREMDQIKESESFAFGEEELPGEEEKGVKMEKLDLSQFNNRDSDFSTILEAGTQSAQKDYFDEDSTITLNGFSKKISETKEDVDLGTSDGTKETSASPEEKLADEDTLEDFDELDFEQESVELLKDEELKENLGVEEDTEQLAEDPNLAVQDQQKELREEHLRQEDSAAILPHEQEQQPSDQEDSEESSFKESKIISQTLGEILVSQKKYTEALEVFKTLKEKQPDNQNVQRKIKLLEQIIDLENK